jgi:dihydroneopterin aldolase
MSLHYKEQFGKIFAVYSQNHIKTINALCEQNADLLNAESVSYILIAVLWGFNE